MKDITRREALRNGTAGLFAVGTAGLAGCTGSIPGVGSSYDGPTLENWLIEPSVSAAFDDDGAAEYWKEQREDDTSIGQVLDDVTVTGEVTSREFYYIVPEAIFDHEEERSGLGRLAGGSSFRDTIGISEHDTDWYLRQRFDYEYEHEYSYADENDPEPETSTEEIQMEIVSASFDRDDVEYHLDRAIGRLDDEDDDVDIDLVNEGSYEDHELWVFEVDDGDVEQRQAVYAVGDSHVIEIAATTEHGGFSDDDPPTYIDTVDLLEQVLDARWHGDGRWVDTDDGTELLEQYETGSWGGITEELTESDGDDTDDDGSVAAWEDGLVGSVYAVDLDGSTSEYTQIYLYQNERNASVDDLRDHVETNQNRGSEFQHLEDISISEEGRVLVLTGTQPTSAA